MIGFKAALANTSRDFPPSFFLIFLGCALAKRLAVEQGVIKSQACSPTHCVSARKGWSHRGMKTRPDLHIPGTKQAQKNTPHQQHGKPGNSLRCLTPMQARRCHNKEARSKERQTDRPLHSTPLHSSAPHT